MKNVILTVVFGVVAAGAGISLVVAADHYGWIGGEGPAGPSATDPCAHEILADRCPFCHPELVDSLGWCSGHDVAEALCTRCNGDLVPAFKTVGDWCAEHGLPESQCALCADDGTVVPASLKASNVSASQSDVLRANRPPSSTCANAFASVVLESAQVARRAGLAVETVRTETVRETVTCSAQIAFNGDRLANLASRAPGTVAEVKVSLGDRVGAGDVLAVIESSELGSAKAAYLQAMSLVDLWQRNQDREQRLAERNVGTERDVLEAETRLVESRVQLSSARQHLSNLGLSAADIERIAADQDTSALLPLRAPFAGRVIDRRAVVGEVISISQPLFSVADTSSMWVMLDVNEHDVPRLNQGQIVRMSIDALPGSVFEGSLTWISSSVNPRTRTIAARAEIANPDDRVRANMFGRAEVSIRTIENAVLVPEAAVQWDGCCNVVFVRHTDTVYQPYKVTLGYKQDGYYVVEAGVPAGESVVTQGSFLLKTEILKGNIGAGCCEVDPGANK